MEFERLLTLYETAEVLNVSIRTLFRIRQAGALRGVRVNRRLRFTWEQINEYIRRGTVKPDVKKAVKAKAPKDPEMNLALRDLVEEHSLVF